MDSADQPIGLESQSYFLWSSAPDSELLDLAERDKLRDPAVLEQLLLLFTWIRDPMLAMIAMSLSSFAAEFSGPISWTSAMDIGGERVGTVSGFMNMLGHFGGSVAPAVTGLLLAVSGNAWTVAFYCSALIYAAGALCWPFIDPVTPLDLERPL